MQTICLVILTIIVCGVVLHLLKILFLPFLLAVFISLGLSSFIGLLVQRLRLPTTAAVGITLLITLVVFWLVGPVVASLVSWPIILLSPDLSTPIMVIALLLPGALFFIVANFVEPRILGRSVQIQPLAVLLALMFWGVLWGPLGIVLATPITGILALLASYSSLTRPVANLLSGQTVWRASTEKTD